MKKLSKIDESTWGNILDKGRGDVERKEDTFTFNINDMKPVDLGPDFPFYWADIDLEANGEILFNWFETQKMIPQINKTGWRLPYGPHEIRDIIKIIDNSDNIDATWKPLAFGILKNNDTGEYVSFPTFNKWSDDYWCDEDHHKKEDIDKYENAREFEIGNYNFEAGKKMVLIRTNNMKKTEKAKIRLVKDK